MVVREQLVSVCAGCGPAGAGGYCAGLPHWARSWQQVPETPQFVENLLCHWCGKLSRSVCRWWAYWRRWALCRIWHWDASWQPTTGACWRYAAHVLGHTVLLRPVHVCWHAVHLVMQH